MDAVPGVVIAEPETEAVPATARPASGVGMRTWATGFGFSSRIGADRNGPGYTTRRSGVTFGIDRFFDPTVLAGVTFSASRSHTKAPNVRAEAETLSGGGYVFWSPHAGWEVDGLLSLNWSEIETLRVLAFDGVPTPTRGDTGGLGASAFANAGYRFRMPIAAGEAYAKPFAGLAYSSQRRDGFAEVGFFGAGLGFPLKTFERGALNLGLTLGTNLTAVAGWAIRPEIRVAYSRFLNDPSPSVPAFLGGTALTLRDPDPGRDGALLALELAAYQTGSFEFFTGYAGEFRSNATAHQGRVGVRLSW